MKLIIDPDTDSRENLNLMSKIIQAKIADRFEAFDSDKTVDCLLDLINHLEEIIGKAIPLEDLYSEMKKKGIDKSTTKNAVDVLKKSGDIFEPKKGIIQRI